VLSCIDGDSEESGPTGSDFQFRLEGGDWQDMILEKDSQWTETATPPVWKTVTNPFEFTTAGTYDFRCRFCVDGTCTDWGEPCAASVTIPPETICDFSCTDLVAYDSEWVEIPAETLTSGELEVPQTVYFVVKGDNTCEDPLTQARLKFASEADNAWRYSSQAPPTGAAEDCDDGTYKCFYWEIEFTDPECVDVETDVCLEDNCR